MPIHWNLESADRRDDPVSGARIIQLTSAAAISNNIYGEQPYTSPDGRRVVIARCQDFCWDEEGSLLVHELDTLRITMVVRRAKGVRNVCNAAWSGLVYYWTPERKLMQLSLMTLAQKEIYAEEDPSVASPGDGGACSVSPDQRYLIWVSPRLKGRGAPVFQIIRLDLQKKTREVIFEHPEISNPHLQFNPVHGKQILVQNDVGRRLKKDGSVEQYKASGGRLFVIDADGRNLRVLPVVDGITGHECFVADTGRVLFSGNWVKQSDYDWRHTPRQPRGNLFTALPGDKTPIVFEAPEHRFNHVCASRCGRYFVADSHTGPGLFENGRFKPVSLVIGSLVTGKFRTLVENTEGTGGGNQCTHTHPYLTADNRHVIFNDDPAGIPQVFAARIPPGFLESLL